ncbi:hypothetical protein CVM50_10870 [Pseudooceanicola marinus]|nr:hypothetical protein CVM50_10870 [Pseudooceanicola marinus]
MGHPGGQAFLGGPVGDLAVVVAFSPSVGLDRPISRLTGSDWPFPSTPTTATDSPSVQRQVQRAQAVTTVQGHARRGSAPPLRRAVRQPLFLRGEQTFVVSALEAVPMEVLRDA